MAPSLGISLPITEDVGCWNMLDQKLVSCDANEGLKHQDGTQQIFNFKW